jgi:hypothetical protein
MELNPSKIFVHKSSINNFLFGQMRQAFPNAEIEIISTNTRLEKQQYGLIDISPKKRGKQKRQYVGMLHRASQWKLDPNGRSTDFLPSNMLGYGCRFMCSYCYVDRRDPATFPKLYDDALNVIDLVHRAQKTCKHLILLRQGTKDKSILLDNRFNITDFGLEILKLKRVDI